MPKNIGQKGTTRTSHFWEQIYINKRLDSIILSLSLSIGKQVKRLGQVSLKQINLGFDLHLGMKF